MQCNGGQKFHAFSLLLVLFSDLYISDSQFNKPPSCKNYEEEDKDVEIFHFENSLNNRRGKSVGLQRSWESMYQDFSWRLISPAQELRVRTHQLCWFSSP